MSRKASIIVCTYNAEDDLKDCLESLEKQDYDDKEIVVIDDASTDGTGEFLRRFKSQSKTRIIVRTNKTNLGVAGSRNEGIRHATGEIMAFTDSDCVADGRWLSELIHIYDEKDVAAVGGKILDARIENIWQLTNKGHDFVAASEGYVSFIKGCNMSFDGDLLRKFQFNEEIKYGYEEILLCNNLVANGYKVYYRPQAIVHHKHRASLRGLLKQKYLRGESSIWYLKKQNEFFMYKRHFILFFALCFIPLVLIDNLFFYIALTLFSVFCASLLREELVFNEKNIKEIIVTFPFLLFIEFAHFLGSCAGVVKFRVMEPRIIE